MDPEQMAAPIPQTLKTAAAAHKDTCVLAVSFSQQAQEPPALSLSSLLRTVD
jgi:hypothetical protein